MTNRIRILSESMANRIAAGEVVERPASVVKELVENSLDAGARNVKVEATGSGRQLIRVEDDGGGMSPDDLLLSLERHATSKVSSVDDLYAVKTLGFRGEALPSIASVSRMRITSSMGNGEPGKMVYIEGGVIKKVAEEVRARGTSVEVRSLFYNTPARLKFLKSKATEQGWITTFLQHQALAHLGVRFKLRLGGREVVNAPPATSPRDRIASLMGTRLAEELVEIEHRRGPLTLKGLISDPSLSRSGRDLQFIFVNGRWVRERSAQAAIVRGYRTLLPRGRHPVVFFYLTLDPSLVDVNVHPAKLEVKFQNSGEVHEAIVEAIGRALGSSMRSRAVARASTDKEGGGGYRGEMAMAAPGSGGEASRRTGQEAAREGGQTAGEERVAGSLTAPLPPSGRSFDGRGNQAGPVDTPAADATGYPPAAHHQGQETMVRKAPPLERQFRLPVSSKLYPLGQVDRAFIVAESSGGIVIIDQHTAHERVLYERIMGQFRDSKVESQYLLIPRPVSLSSLELSMIEERGEEFGKLGFSVEAFGKGTALLRSVPALLAEADCTTLFQEMAAQLVEVGRLKPFEELAEELAVMMACKGAIKAGEPLDNSRMTALLRDLESLEQPASCPHGRPIYLLLDIREIRKRFLRK